MVKYSMRYWLTICVLFVCVETKAQVIQLHDSLYSLIPYGENFQSIEVEQSPVSNAIYLYSAFDLSTYSVINIYEASSPSFTSYLKLLKSYTLPNNYSHPNDIEIVGDTLIVANTSDSEISRIGFFEKKTGAMIGEIVDTLSTGWRLWACYYYHETLYRIISNSVQVELQQYANNRFKKVWQFVPPPMRDQYNYIQGCTIISDRVLAVLTSSANRIDFYDLQHDGAYLGRYFCEEGGLQAQGITCIDSPENIFIYYGLRFPNKVKQAIFPKNLSVPEFSYPPNDSLIAEHSISFAWKPVLGATKYDVMISSDPEFQKNVILDSNIATSVYVKNISIPGKYYWSIRAKNFLTVSNWSQSKTFQLPVIQTKSFDSLNIYWGEFHAHTELSYDATGSIDSFYIKARDQDKLDIAIATDHDVNSTNEIWERSKRAANTYYVPGKFVTMLAYEWTNDGFEWGGHRTVYYSKDDAKRFISKNPDIPSKMTLDELVGSVRDEGGIMIIAHPDYTPANIRFIDPRIQIGVEFFGYQGYSFEYFGNPFGAPSQYENNSAQDVLIRGGIVGAYGVGDSHVGVGGRRGLTAIIADTLTRGSIFSAMKQRRVYASTGPRASMYFATKELMMGDVGYISKTPISFNIKIDSPDSIQSISLMRNTTSIITLASLNMKKASVELTDMSPLSEPSFYYLRIRFTSGHRMWSTPIYFLKPAVTANSIESSTAQPSLSLYPSPNRGVFSIRYFLKEMSTPDIAVYDILGRRVQTFISGEQGVGFQEQIINANHLSNGIYFVKIQTGSDRQLKKFVILK